MAASIENLYVGDGSTVLYSFTFPYIEESDVLVTLDGASTTQFSIVNATTVELVSAPAAGVVIRIYRSTSADDPKAIFYPGSAIRGQDLNANFEQNLYVIQEAVFDNANSAIDSAAARATAEAADTKADTAIADSSAAQASAAQAQSDATSAAADAAQAQSDATSAASNASAAQIAANQANTAVQSAAIFAPVSNVAAIPGSPSDQDRVSVLDSTGITGFTPLTGLPVGPTYDSGAYVNLVYQLAQSTWQFVSYGSNDPDGRYLLDQPNTVSTANIATAAVTPAELDRTYQETVGGAVVGPVVTDAIKGNPDLGLSSGNTQVARAVGSALVFTDDPNQGVTGIATGDSPNDAGFVTKGALRLQNTDGPGLILSKKISSIAAAPGSTYISFVRSGQPGASGSISHPSNNPAQIAYNTTSDYRLKENVLPLTGTWDRFKQLKPSTFTFISDPGKNLVEGFIAHEVQAVVPGAVTGEKDFVDAEGIPQYQGVDLGRLVPLLTAVLQEALERIEALEAKI
jgi:hypothetical protein